MLNFYITIDTLLCKGKVKVEELNWTGMLDVRSLFCFHLSSFASFPAPLPFSLSTPEPCVQTRAR